MSFAFRSRTSFVTMALLLAMLLCSVNIHAQEGGETDTGSSEAKSGEDANGASEKTDYYDGFGAFAGISLGIGPSMLGDEADTEMGGAFLAAIRAGALIRRFEIQLEFAPMSYFPKLGEESVLTGNATLGFLAHIKGDFYWPLRIGVGFARKDGEGAFQARGDLIGVAYRKGPWSFELSAPSFRYTAYSDFKISHWGWPITFSVYRVF